MATKRKRKRKSRSRREIAKRAFAKSDPELLDLISGYVAGHMEYSQLVTDVFTGKKPKAKA